MRLCESCVSPKNIPGTHWRAESKRQFIVNKSDEHDILSARPPLPGVLMSEAGPWLRRWALDIDQRKVESLVKPR